MPFAHRKPYSQILTQVERFEVAVWHHRTDPPQWYAHIVAENLFWVRRWLLWRIEGTFPVDVKTMLTCGYWISDEHARMWQGYADEVEWQFPNNQPDDDYNEWCAENKARNRNNAKYRGWWGRIMLWWDSRQTRKHAARDDSVCPF